MMISVTCQETSMRALPLAFAVLATGDERLLADLCVLGQR